MVIAQLACSEFMKLYLSEFIAVTLVKHLTWHHLIISKETPPVASIVELRLAEFHCYEINLVSH